MPPPPWPTGTFLARLPDQARRDLLTLGTLRDYPAGHTLIEQGDRSDLVFVLMRGLTKVTAANENGTTALLAVRVRGDVVGDMAAVDGAARSATVVTCGATVARLIKGDAFLAYLRTRPAAALALATFGGDRLRWANQRRLEFSGYPGDVCLARLLLTLAARHGTPGPEGTELGVPLTQIELGGLIGAKESTVHKALRDFTAHGLVHRTGPRRIVITDLPGLLRRADLPPGRDKP
ncbi:Crp/Fnr family transcriptional regulator [Sinosporangium siamense]|uniref:Crp/Fnr family transcriptional regulator n=1 Tax=Sinosporangium siamense TaxID=1367973 RepID=A0A919RM55_9ACTN|nr:Crp/Fnr family transcriptional regulator [Sinosporangium siamense]GII96113.1 hypothetical protein Ssi02_63440 [Sinosporangium siamense]